MRTLMLIFALMAAAPARAAEPVSYAGLTGATVMDSGVMVVSGGGPFDREESFEYVRKPDGGITLLNSITATSGAYRVAARFDLDRDWRSVSATGLGLYGGKPVDILMKRNGKVVDISVAGAGQTATPTATCDPDCFINMSPSITSMFVMTRHYDLKAGGVQEFRWAGQDLDRVRTLSGGKARLKYENEKTLTRATGEKIAIRHFTFVEELPTPDGGTYKLNFDMWTDTEHRPFGFRVRVPNGPPSGLLGLRKGYEDIKTDLTSQAPSQK